MMAPRVSSSRSRTSSTAATSIARSSAPKRISIARNLEAVRREQAAMLGAEMRLDRRASASPTTHFP